MNDARDSGKIPTVTVAMVTYNSARFVSEAIASVLTQDFEDFELLVCDDCSMDATWDVVQRVSDPRVRATRNEVNIGEYRNRNHALSRARGKYIIFIDGDDYLYPHGLAYMVRMLESFPRAAFASAQQPSDKFIYPVELTPQEFCSCVFFGPLVIGANFTQMLFRVDALREIGGFDLRFRTGDTHIQFALGMRYNTLLINGGLAWWRQRPGQASAPVLRDGIGLAEMSRYARETLEHPDCPLSPDEKRLAKTFVYRPILRRIARNVIKRDYGRARQLYEISGVPLREWRWMFAKWDRPYLSDVNGDNPIHLGISLRDEEVNHAA